MTGNFAAAPSDSYTLQKQYFSGNTNCGCTTDPNTFQTTCPYTVGGPITYIQNVSPTSPHSISLPTTDSVRLQAAYGSNRNGQNQGWQIAPNSDTGVTLTYLPGNAVCVRANDALTHNVKAFFTPGLQTLDATCTTPKFLFSAGETVCVRAVGTAATPSNLWKIYLSGGSPNSCSSFPGLPAYPGTPINSETATATFTLPTSNAAIPAGCTSNNTTDIRGQWSATLLDQSNSSRGGDQFRVRTSTPAYDLSVNQSVSDRNNGGNFPPAGFIKYSVGVQHSGPDPAPNVSLVVSRPASSTFLSMTQTAGPAFTCGAPSGVNVTCTRSTLQPDDFATFELLVQYSGQANNAVLSNSATVTSSGNELYGPNNTTSGDITISTNTLIAQFICPADITLPSTSAAGRAVTYGAYTCTAPCTGSVQTFGGASGSVFPIGTTIVGYQGVTSNGLCTFKINITDGQRPDLSLTKTHTGNFVRGGKGEYSLVVKNTGSVATSGLVTLSDPLQVKADQFSNTGEGILGLVPTSLSGTGWNCNFATLSCSRSDVLAAGASYPPVMLAVNVARNQVSSFRNRANVYGGNQFVTGNDISDDQTIVVAPRADTKSEMEMHGDFNGDGRDDILLVDSSGSIGMWLMNGSAIIGGGLVGSPGASTIAGLGDFNGDGRSDILLRDASGNLGMWIMNGNVITSGHFVGSPGAYTVAGVADFNGDNKADILLRDGTGTLGMWIMNGPVVTSGHLVGSPGAYTVAAVADFNADNRADILIKDTGGSVGLWIMNAHVVTSGNLVGSLGAYSVVGVNDFNGDSRADIVLRDSLGNIGMWIMNAHVITSGHLVGSPGAYTVNSVGDYNNDSRADILLRQSTSGDIGGWQMNGPVITTGYFVGSPGPNFIVY